MSETFDCNGKEIHIEKFSGILCDEGPLYPVDANSIAAGRAVNAFNNPQFGNLIIVSDVNHINNEDKIKGLYLGSYDFTPSDLFHYWLVRKKCTENRLDSKYKFYVAVSMDVKRNQVTSVNDMHELNEFVAEYVKSRIVESFLNME